MTDETTKVSAKEELLDLARLYLEADQAEKEARNEKALLRGPIMDLMTEVVIEEVPLDVKTVRIDKNELDIVFDGDVRKWAALKYPEWVVTGHKLQNRGIDAYVVTLKESESLTKYEFSVDGFKWGRTVSHSSPEIDVEGLVEDPDFKELGPEAEKLIETTVVHDIDEKAAGSFLLKRPESAPIFSRYTEPGKVGAKLLPFTKMTEDE